MPGTNILFKKDSVFQKCPECKKNGTLRVSRSRNIWETLIKRFTVLKLFRCKECGWRGYKSTLGFTFESFKTLLMYIAIALICGLAVKMIIQRFL
ncbi:MAG: hypothetical protein KJ571_08380 [Bacteroidetes bacterium]|nr:hypothetical protein [Bacteroidota bacterium]